MDDFYLKVVQMLKSGHTLVMATIISQEGSSPREVGTKCLITDDGSLIGSVGGGILEARTVREARKVFKSGLPVRVPFSLDGSDAAAADMLCGGRSEIFLELISPDNPLHVSMFQGILNIKRPDEGGLLATVIDPEKWKNGAIQKVFIKQDGQIIGGLPAAGDYINALLNISANLPKSGEAKIFELHDQQSHMEIFVEPVVMRPLLYIFGCGHVSKEITPLARRVGFSVIVIDDRPEFADPKSFPEASEVRLLDFDGVMNSLAVDEFSYLVIVTRGHAHDMIVLAQALKTKAKYIGMIGSSRKTGLIYEKLIEKGFSGHDLDRVHAPIGIDIGAETPAEIAVSIVSEMIMVRSGKKANAMSLKLSWACPGKMS